ncbi:hypothetical protein AOLI_G00214610 [Acnodon oligacanthus]
MFLQGRVSPYLVLAQMKLLHDERFSSSTAYWSAPSPSTAFCLASFPLWDPSFSQCACVSRSTLRTKEISSLCHLRGPLQTSCSPTLSSIWWSLTSLAERKSLFHLVPLFADMETQYGCLADQHLAVTL